MLSTFLGAWVFLLAIYQPGSTSHVPQTQPLVVGPYTYFADCDADRTAMNALTMTSSKWDAKPCREQ